MIRTAYGDHSRWWIFRGIWWYVMPPKSVGVNRVELTARFDTFEEARLYYIREAAS